MEDFTIRKNGCSSATNAYPQKSGAGYERQIAAQAADTAVPQSAAAAGENTELALKSLDVAGLEGKLNLETGELITTFCDIPAENSVMGLAVSHSYKQNRGERFAGKNFVLNLNETLVKNANPAATGSSANYLYTDGDGNTHGIGEYFYILKDDGAKEPVTKGETEIRSDGSLYKDGCKVYTEYRSTTGLKLIPQVDAQGNSGVFKNNKLFENRSDEEKQLEEQVKGYENALKEFVFLEFRISSEPTALPAIKDIADYSTVMAGLPANKFILPRAEALQCKALKKQSVSLTDKSSSNIYPNHNTDILKELSMTELSAAEHAKMLIEKVTSLPMSVDRSIMLDCLDGGDIIPYKNFENAFPVSVEDEKTREENKEIHKTFRQRNLCIEQLQTQKENIDYQKTTIWEQLDIITDKRDYYIETARSYYKEYVNKKFALETLRKHTPVNFLTDGGTYKGFNKDGLLVAVFDENEHYAAIEYEVCTQNAADYDRIKQIYDKDGNAVTFKYRMDDGLLDSVTDIRGNKTKYEYEKGLLKKVTYPDGENLSFTFSSDGVLLLNVKTAIRSANLSYSSDGLFNLLVNYSLFKSITGAGVTSDSNKKLNQTNISYSIKDGSPICRQVDIVGDNYKERFVLNPDNVILEYYLEENGVVTKAEKGQLNGYVMLKSVAEQSDLYKTPLSEYSMGSSRLEVTQYNESNVPYFFRRSECFHVDENGKRERQIVTTLTFDGEGRVIKETNDITLTNPSEKKRAYKSYKYNSRGKLTRTESWVEGEEQTLGKTVEENFYGENGKLTKSCTYNSLDPTSKFWTEKAATAEEAEQEQSAAELAYGADGNVTAITQSTEEGEENSTRVRRTQGCITELTDGNNVINYEYDYKCRPTAVHINGTPEYVKYAYAENETLTLNGVSARTDRVTVTYAAREENGSHDVLETVKDKFGNVLKTTCNGEVQTERAYDKDGNLTKLDDKITGLTTRLGYDEIGRIDVAEIKSGKILQSSEIFRYGAAGLLTSREITGSYYPQFYEYSYEENSAQRLLCVKYNSDLTYERKYDLLGRNAGRDITLRGESYGERVKYVKKGDRATNQPSTLEYLRKYDGVYRTDGVIKYAYDKRGNISKIYKNGRLTNRYFYDSLNRLIREDNGEFKKTYLFAYDCNGNIISKRSMNYTLIASELIEERFGQEIAGGMDSNGMPIYPSATEELAYYDGDKLIQYGEANGAHYFTYDRLGNPNSYNGLECIFEHGGRLKKLGDTTFSYDGLGRRIGKNGVTYGYDTEGRLITQSGNGGTINFIYDGNEIIGISYNGDAHYFRKDIQGNVVEILGLHYARYEYDAWGNCKMFDNVGNELYDDLTHIGSINPIRYRSYYYDNETKLYYLQTRYYDPSIGRFISSDAVENLDPETINGLNLYAYCGNNHVMNVDPMGTAWWNPFSWDWAAIGRFVGGAVLSVVGLSITGSNLFAALVDPVSTVVAEIGLTIGMYGVALMGSAVDSTIYSDMEMIGWNPFNTNAEFASYSQKMSFYKGVPILRIPISNGRSGTFGVMVLVPGETANTVKHEFGHIPQLMVLGIFKFGICIGIPSALSWQGNWGNNYQSPTEAGAEFFGGANNYNLATKDVIRAIKYLVISNIIGPFALALYKYM